MNKVTKEDKLRILEEMKTAYKKDLEDERDNLSSEFCMFDELTRERHLKSNELNQTELEPICEAIRSLIENMDKKVSREFVQRWADKFSPDSRIGLQGDRAINHLWWREEQIISMLTELGQEVEE